MRIQVYAMQNAKMDLFLRMLSKDYAGKQQTRDKSRLMN
jgi:hypothetical protein